MCSEISLKTFLTESQWKLWNKNAIISAIVSERSNKFTFWQIEKTRRVEINNFQSWLSSFELQKCKTDTRGSGNSEAIRQGKLMNDDKWQVHQRINIFLQVVLLSVAHKLKIKTEFITIMHHRMLTAHSSQTSRLINCLVVSRLLQEVQNGDYETTFGKTVNNSSILCRLFVVFYCFEPPWPIATRQMLSNISYAFFFVFHQFWLN